MQPSGWPLPAGCPAHASNPLLSGAGSGTQNRISPWPCPPPVAGCQQWGSWESGGPCPLSPPGSPLQSAQLGGWGGMHGGGFSPSPAASDQPGFSPQPTPNTCQQWGGAERKPLPCRPSPPDPVRMCQGSRFPPYPPHH